MTPPISPAMVGRGSVINQGPMAGRPPSVGPPLSSHSHCASYPEPLYQTVPQTNQNFYGVSAGYPVMFRTQTHPSSAPYQHRPEASHFAASNEQQRFSRDYFSSSCAVSPYSTRSPPNYGSSSTVQEAHSMQFLNSGSYNFMNSPAASSGQGSSYSSNASNGTKMFRFFKLLISIDLYFFPSAPKFMYILSNTTSGSYRHLGTHS